MNIIYRYNKCLPKDYAECSNAIKLRYLDNGGTSFGIIKAKDRYSNTYLVDTEDFGMAMIVLPKRKVGPVFRHWFF